MNKKLEKFVDRLVKKLYKEEFYKEPIQEKNYSSYWDEKGKYQKAYNKLYELLVPSRYGCSHPPSEALRVLSKAYYRYYNDGDSVSKEVYDLVKAVL